MVHILIIIINIRFIRNIQLINNFGDISTRTSENIKGTVTECAYHHHDNDDDHHS